jgi:hypothetical protein
MMEQEYASVKLPTADMNNVYDAALILLETLKAAKPNDRSDKDRAVAVAITDAQKLISWIKVWCFE